MRADRRIPWRLPTSRSCSRKRTFNCKRILSARLQLATGRVPRQSVGVFMARVTIQDCLTHIPSRFDLTLVAAKRARQLARGAEAKLPWNGHKSTVLALQEIAEGATTAAVLKEVDLPALKAPSADLGMIDPFADYIA